MTHFAQQFSGGYRATRNNRGRYVGKGAEWREHYLGRRNRLEICRKDLPGLLGVCVGLVDCDLVS